jgi:NTE family protein
LTDGPVVLVLSGGGAKAAAHVGAVRAVLEARLTPERYVATSMGAVVAAGLAAGLSGDQVLDRLVEAGGSGIARARLAPLGGLWLGSLMRAAPLRRALERFLPVTRFSELGVPLTVSATDLDSGERILFGAGGEDAPLTDALMASCALPLFYPPVMLDGRRLADGGLRGVLPLDLVPRDAGRVIAVDIGPGFDELAAGPSPYPSLLRAHSDATGILMAENTALQLARWRADAARPVLTYVRPRVERNATFRVERAREYAEAGYRAARAALADAGP